MPIFRRARITQAAAVQKYGEDKLYKLAATRRLIPTWGTDGVTYDAVKLDREVKKTN
jgi:hypothetical protein